MLCHVPAAYAQCALALDALLMYLRRLAAREQCRRAGGRGVDCEHTRWSCEEQREQVVPASYATLAACSASLAHALQELWRARVLGCSLFFAGSDPFTISTMSGLQESHTGSGSGAQ